jgi:hypothetical protein
LPHDDTTDAIAARLAALALQLYRFAPFAARCLLELQLRAFDPAVRRHRAELALRAGRAAVTLRSALARFSRITILAACSAANAIADAHELFDVERVLLTRANCVAKFK